VRVFLAGAAGVIGRPLVAQLLGAGHEVTGTTRREDRAVALRAAGMQAVVCDLLDRDAAAAAVRAAAPEVVIDQLTSLPRDYDIRRRDLYDATNRVRRDGTANLLAAARAAGARRYLLQSISFLTRPAGPPVLDEDAPAWTDAPAPFGESVRILLGSEQAVTGAGDIEGLVLRYGLFYGPGTYYAADGAIAAEVRRRRFPLVGTGAGISSYIHVADAAAATVAALGHGAPGVYNVTDDEPAALRDWLPVYARAIGARPPRRVPRWVARLLAGAFPAALATGARGAANARARAQLAWAPMLPTWREGFASHLDSDPTPR
jgi:nucleoside-diphosphate-sugar epimerase